MSNPTEITPVLYVRKSFEVQAVQLTDENLEAVAEWCGGKIRQTKGSDTRPPCPYVKVKVYRPMNERQTMGFPGDWVFDDGKSFKVYTKNAFDKSFEEPEPPSFDTPVEAPSQEEMLLEVSG